MALSAKAKLIADLQDDLSNIDDTLKNIANDIGISIKNKLSDLKDDTGQWLDEFEKGEDVVGKLNTKLKAIQKDTNKLGLDRLKLENQLKIAVRNGSVAEQNRLDKKILANKLATKQLEDTQTLIIKLKQAAEEEKKITEEKKKQDSILGLLKTKYQDIAKNFTAAGIFKFFIDAILKANAQTTQLGKSLGVSSKLANNIRQDFVEYSRASGNAFINTDRLLKAQAELSEQLGIAVQFSGEELETFSRLTEIVGLTAQEAGNLARFSAATGITSKDYVKQARTSAFYAQQTNRIHISDKELLSSISKLSAGITTKFQNNPKALAEAVIQAKALGLTLEQIDKTSESLLNFETSIENELKAELITGKQLNFERARAAALTGDQATLMQEVAAQAGSLAEFQNMNVIAQKSLAEAFGLSREEMADMLMKQEAIAQYGDEAAKLNKEQLEDMKRRNMTAEEYLTMSDNQRSIQEKFNDAMLKLQDIIGNLVAGPFGQMLNVISSILEHTTALAAIMGGAMVLNFMKVLSVMKQAKKISYGAAVVEIIKSAYQSIGGLPGVGMILAGAAAAAGISYLASQSAQSVEDGIAPSDRGPFTITDSFGATAGTAKGDSLYVGPNINKGGGGMDISPLIAAMSEVKNTIIGEARSESITPLNPPRASGILGGDISPLVAVMNEVRNAITALANKPQQAMSIQVGPDKLGEVVGNQLSTGTSQAKNTSYSLA